MTLAAIVCGVVGLILAGGWVNDIFVQLGEALIHSQSGHLQVYKQGFYAAGSRAPEKYLIANPADVSNSLASSAHVDSVMARLNFSGLLNNGRSDMPIIGEGVEPGKEARLGSFVQIIKGRRLADKDTFGIEVGQGLAKSLKLSPGDSVNLLANTLDGALNNLEFEVVGVFQSFSNDYDARAIKIPLAAAQELIATKGANALVVSLKKTADTDRVAAGFKTQLAASNLEVKTWVELNDFYEKTVDLYRRQFGVLQLIILFMVLLGVANSVNMSVFERVGEFGTMMSLGNRSSHVTRLILTESVLLGLIGSSIGVALGVALALAISAIGIPMPPPPNANIGYTARIQIIPSALLVSFAIGFVATVVAAILPARRVS
ncbi:MAG TPA: ABC transporter permease, partial [Burkholderiales bacterium]|nr:ABC transporter permease [Burkholderiales bacterium]